MRRLAAIALVALLACSACASRVAGEEQAKPVQGSANMLSLPHAISFGSFQGPANPLCVSTLQGAPTGVFACSTEAPIGPVLSGFYVTKNEMKKMAASIEPAKSCVADRITLKGAQTTVTISTRKQVKAVVIEMSTEYVVLFVTGHVFGGAIPIADIVETVDGNPSAAMLLRQCEGVESGAAKSVPAALNQAEGKSDGLVKAVVEKDTIRYAPPDNGSLGTFLGNLSLTLPGLAKSTWTLEPAPLQDCGLALLNGGERNGVFVLVGRLGTAGASGEWDGSELALKYSVPEEQVQSLQGDHMTLITVAEKLEPIVVSYSSGVVFIYRPYFPRTSALL